MFGAPRTETGNFPLYVLLVVGLSVLVTWCHNETGGSILVAMVLHAGVNASGVFLPLPFERMADVPAIIDLGMVAGVWLAAIGVIVLRDTRTLSRGGFPGGDRQAGAGHPETGSAASRPGDD